jgi:tetratricopeptide (TPR) repeat protein
MKEHVTADGHWDAFIIGTLVIDHLIEFLPAQLHGDDVASEAYRNCVHQALYLRNAIAHPPAPTAAECLAGLGAVLEVLKVHGQAAVVTQLQPLLGQLRSIATLPPGNNTAGIVLSDDVLTLWALEAAMQHFGDDLGFRIRDYYHPSSHAPSLPMNVGGDKSICNALRNGKVNDGHNPALKLWPAYWSLPVPARTNLVAAVDRTAALRNQLNHKQHEIDRAGATSGIGDMITIQTTLALPSDKLTSLHMHLTDANGMLTVAADVSGAMHIPFKDPRKYLVGRGHLIADVATRLQTSAQCVEVLHGESGAGKTVASIAVAYELLLTLPVQLFMQGSSVATLRMELARYARLHVGGVDESADDDKLVDAARKHLAYSTGWLLLVDDVGPDLNGVLKLLPTNDSGSPIGHVLLTSQRRSVWPTTVHTTEVGKLLTEESMSFLGRGDKKQRVDEAVLESKSINLRKYVEHDLGNLALDVALLKNALKGITDVTEAAAIVGRWCEEPAANLESAQDMSESHRRSLRRRNGVVRELMRRFETSCEGDGALLLGVRALLAICCVLDPAGVPSVLFTGGAAAISEYAPGACLFRDAELYARAARVLADVGLVHGDSSEALNMHQLVQTCVRHELRRGEAVGLREWGTLWAVFGKRYVAEVGNHESRKVATALHKSALALYRRCDGGAALLAPLAQAELGQAIGRWFVEAGGRFNWNEALPLLERALEIHEAELGLNHFSTTSSLNNLASLHQAMGEHAKAVPLYELALEIREAHLGPDHPLTATVLDNLGLLHVAMGEHAKALPMVQRALGIYEAQLGPDHLDTVQSLNHVATVLGVSGKHAQALPLFERVLEICEARLMHDHPLMAEVINNLAGQYENLGEHTKALPLYERALGICEAQRGPDHPQTATCLGNLAGLHDVMGEHAKALPLYERALGICEEHLGPDHHLMPTILNNLAMLYKEMHEHAKALPLYERALGICEARLGQNHPSTAGILRNFAKLHEDFGDYAKALPLYERALDICDLRLGPDPLTASILDHLAGLHDVMGEHAKALPLYERALGICEEHLGPDHQLTPTVLNNLAMLYEAMHEHAKALPLLQRALGICEAQLGQNHPSSAQILNKLANLQRNLDKHAKALPLYERALEICDSRLGHDHPLTITVLGNLAGLHEAMGEHAKALPLYERLGICEAQHSSLRNLAELHVAMGEHAKALPLLERALGIREAQLGPDHPDTASSLNSLAELYLAMGEHAQALPLLERALGIREAQLEPDHSLTAQSLNNLSQLHMAMGEQAEALRLQERALGICEAQLEPDDPDTAACLHNLAVWHITMGEHAKALPLLERALRMCEARVGPDHPATKSVFRALVTCRLSTCRSDCLGMEIFRRLFLPTVQHGVDHQDINRACSNPLAAFFGLSMGTDEDMDDELATALALSMRTDEDAHDELRTARMLSMETDAPSQPCIAATPHAVVAQGLSMGIDEDMDDELATALALSMETDEDAHDELRRALMFSMETDAPSQPCIAAAPHAVVAHGRDSQCLALMQELRVQLAIESSDDARVLEIACRELGIDFQPSADHFQLAKQLTMLLNGGAAPGEPQT